MVDECPLQRHNKTDRHDITDILLKVALNTISQTKSLQRGIHDPSKNQVIQMSVRVALYLILWTIA
jgi:hypothetical protein